MKAFLKSILESMTFAVCLILGILLAAASFIWYFIPKWKREEEKDIERRVENMKVSVSKAKEERAAGAQVKVAEVEKKAVEQKAQDTVDLANQFIIDEMKK